ncbi:hypothetical protein PSCICM_40190 [Pseudomonas cichorii]|nr:hypothetical protein PSCICM_40190 [Pseudomonas cichorii]
MDVFDDRRQANLEKLEGLGAWLQEITRGFANRQEQSGGAPLLRERRVHPNKMYRLQ